MHYTDKANYRLQVFNKTWSDKKDILSGLLIGALFAFIVFLNYFTEIPIRMQMLVTTISIIAFGLAVRRFIGRKIIFQIMAPGKAGTLYVFLFINCGLWILMGKKLKLLHFSIAGGLGAIVIAYFLII
ncbi:hypothetical protein QUF89_11595 [Peribacillus simplex]|uniref:YitT family protein n=2 Tax=Peribacillus simplex TaxID=1478 RepID=A0AAW7IFK7_9BACI|nr:hypothetical protein [Peribacillus simplex]